MIKITAARLHLDDVVAAVEADDMIGFCVSCGEEAHNVEPDAQEYPCESCGERQVYGAEEILLGVVG